MNKEAGSGPLILWGAGTSRTLRAHWAMAELGLAYECRPIGPRTGETKTEAYTALTARQKVPLLQDGALVLTESVAIMAYLSDRYGSEETALVPRTPVGRATCLEWVAFALSELDAASLYVIRRHRDLADIYGAAPEVCRAAEDYFGQQMRSVERALGSGQRFIGGDRFTAGDIMLSSCLGWAERYGLALSPLVMAYLAAQRARPAFALAMNRNTPPSRPPMTGSRST